ncbi:MAG TPA: hypothetical protein VFJ57_15550 [Solirubrobacterales bacterium]|nr:hypothetical protein [Solirubrobacterales bacterium]
MGAVVTVDFVLQALMDLPADALPGEDRVEAIRELLTTSASLEVEVVGEEACRAATALIESVIDRIAADVDTAAQLAEASGQRYC